MKNDNAVAGIGETEARLRKLVDELVLPKLPENWQTPAADRRLALLELESLGVIIWGQVLEEFLRNYAATFPAPGHEPLNEDELSERFDVAFAEKTQPYTRALLRNDLNGGAPFSLARMAETRHKPNTAGFEKLKKTLLERTIWPMRDLGMYQVDVVSREDDRGRDVVARYNIFAGPALRAFHELVHVPLRSKQISEFVKRYGLPE
jgi:hypothetical protein